MLLLSSPTVAIVSAGDEDDPEIDDQLYDVELAILDIDSAWFFEKEESPDYLFVTMKLDDVAGRINAVYSIRWTFDGVGYVCGLDRFFFRDNEFRSGIPYRANYWQWKRMPFCEGNLDLETLTISWKIPKQYIGNPKAGDILLETRAHAVPGFPLNFLFYVTNLDLRDFAPGGDEFGKPYVIQFG